MDMINKNPEKPGFQGSPNSTKQNVFSIRLQPNVFPKTLKDRKFCLIDNILHPIILLLSRVFVDRCVLHMLVLIIYDNDGDSGLLAHVLG